MALSGYAQSGSGSTGRLRLTLLSAALATIAATIACGGDSFSPLAPGEIPVGLTQTLETESLVFHYAPGDSVDSDWEQQFHEWATARLGVSPPRKIGYFKYRNSSELEAAVGRKGNGWADVNQFQVHTIWPQDSHEIIHLYVHMLGNPPYMFNEGIAVAFQVDPINGRNWPMWDGRHVHEIAKSYRRAGTLPSLASMLGGTDFWDLDDRVTYPTAGSFVFFLIEQRGIDPIIEFCRRSPSIDEPENATRSRFSSVFGQSLDDAEAAWHQMLDTFSG